MEDYFVNKLTRNGYTVDDRSFESENGDYIYILDIALHGTDKKRTMVSDSYYHARESVELIIREGL